MTTHGWKTLSNKDNEATAISLRTDAINQSTQNKEGPKEGTKEHFEIQDKQGFSYSTLR